MRASEIGAGLARLDPRATDIWRVGIVAAEADVLIARGRLDEAPIHWLPERHSFAYDADPFGLWRDGILHLFVEAFDYRTRHGLIDMLRLDRERRLLDRSTVLAEPWHLSYPQVFEAEGEVWLLPEAHRSGVLTLYRAANFPSRWEAAAQIALDPVPVDATAFHHDGRWWLAYAGGVTKWMRQGSLHLASADRLAGPWRAHPMNPVRIDRAGSRPGGSVVVVDGCPTLPVQDCSRTYGGGLRPLRFVTLTADSVETELGDLLVPPSSTDSYREGFHTLSACGPVTLIDAKRIDRSWGGRTIDLQRLLGFDCRY
jgi:hypothetical protein